MAMPNPVRNPFLGINPLLHSLLQTEGRWDNFHVNHISDLTRFLQQALRPLGYVAQAEQSLQIRRRTEPSRMVESDVTVFDPEQRPPTSVTATGGMTIPVAELLALDEVDFASYRAIGVYETLGSKGRGDAVVWIELLSPSNKPGGRHSATYRDKRTALLQAGLVFIELDYLHHQPPTVAIPAYPDAPNSTCYRIVMIDPRPDWLRSDGQVYPIRTDEPLPTINMPLNGRDSIAFDFDAPYQQTFTALFFGDEVDYTRLPVAWERYSASDQARILTRLLVVRQDGLDDSQEAKALTPLPLADALKQWRES